MPEDRVRVYTQRCHCGWGSGQRLFMPVIWHDDIDRDYELSGYNILTLVCPACGYKRSLPNIATIRSSFNDGDNCITIPKMRGMSRLNLDIVLGVKDFHGIPRRRDIRVVLDDRLLTSIKNLREGQKEAYARILDKLIKTAIVRNIFEKDFRPGRGRVRVR